VAYQIKFIAIEIVAKSFKEAPTSLKPGEPINISFNYLVDLNVIPERSLTMVVTNVDIFISPENTDVGNIKTLCVFEVGDFNNVFDIQSGKPTSIPLDLEVLLKSTGLSTTRGLIHSEVKGTYLQGAILPLVDIGTLVVEQRAKAGTNFQAKTKTD